jgi:hypothetical protein
MSMRAPPANRQWPKLNPFSEEPKTGTPPSAPTRTGGASAMRQTAIAM